MDSDMIIMGLAIAIFLLAFFMLVVLVIVNRNINKANKNQLVPGNQTKSQEEELEQALVCPHCKEKDIVLISESKKQWWCNTCSKLFHDLT